MTRPPRPTSSNPSPPAPATFGDALDKAALITAPAGLRTAMVGAHALLRGYVPDIPEPGLAGLTPVVGPLWQAAQRLQNGKYFGAIANTGLAALDGLSAGGGTTGAKTALAINAKLAGTSRNGLAVQKAAREVAGVDGRAWEAHHTIPLGNGKLRLIENWRHNPALIKVLPTATHKRWHGSYLGQPRLGPLARAWYGTTDLMKAGAAQVGARAADTIENFADRSDQRARERKS